MEESLPVINLPQDTRWGDLGKGLGGLIGQIAGAYQEKQLASQVGQMMEDPAIPENKRGVKILEKLGDAGYKKFQELEKSNLVQKQLEQITSQIGGQTILNAYREAETARLKALQPGEVAQQGVQTEAARALIPERKAQTEHLEETTATEKALRGPRVEAETQLGAERKAKTRKEVAEADVEEARVANLRKLLDADATPAAPNASVVSAERMGAVPAGSAAGAAEVANSNPLRGSAQLDQEAEALIAPYAKTMGWGPTEINGAKAQYRAAFVAKKDPAAAIRAYAQEISADKARNRPTTPSSQQINETATSAAVAQAHESFLDELIKDPSKVGLLGGGAIKARIEGLGISSGDPSFLKQWEAQKTQIALQAKVQGALSISGTNIKLSRDLSDNMNNTALAIVLTSKQQAATNKTILQNKMVTTEDSKQSIKGYQNAMEYWDRVAKKADIDMYDYTDSKGATQNIVTWQGNLVDPKTMKTLLGANEKPKLPDKPNMPKTGAEMLSRLARLNASLKADNKPGMSVAEYWAALAHE
jgi:hypothetical protein